MFFTRLVCLPIALFAVGCGIHQAKKKSRHEERQSVTFESVKTDVLGPRCVSCHAQGNNDGGVALDSYEVAKKHAEGIHKSVFDDKSMPPGAPLTSEQNTTLKEWLDMGAPR